MSDMEASLSRVERMALEFGRFANERPWPKRLQKKYLLAVTASWVRPAVSPRVYVEGIEWLLEHQPERGVVLVSNHRSFFDMYIVMLCLFSLRARWIERISFPVRANFFYESPLGMAINAFIGGYTMYPPLYRDANRASLNKDALDRVVSSLQQPGTVVGLHPEGTRGKGPDPYQLLPAQPGVGQIVLNAKPTVVPLFVNGLPNDIYHGIADSYGPNARRKRPIIVVFGPPLDYSEYTRKKPRAALYKRCADKMNRTILELGERERELRHQCATGELADDDPHWLPTFIRARTGR